MGQCCGTLLVHSDGTAAACTEELAGRCCPGPGFTHMGGSVRCTAFLGRGGCEFCGTEHSTGMNWGHVARIADYSRTQGRCTVHGPRRSNVGDAHSRSTGSRSSLRGCGVPVGRVMRGHS